MKHAVTLTLLALTLFPTVGCKTFAAEATPPEIQAIPAQQVVRLDVLLENIATNRTGFVNPDGSLPPSFVVAFLQADKAMWQQLDRFYNPEATEPEPEGPPSE